MDVKGAEADAAILRYEIMPDQPVIGQYVTDTRKVMAYSCMGENYLSIRSSRLLRHPAMGASSALRGGRYKRRWIQTH